MDGSPLARILGMAAVAIDRRFGWDKLPLPLSLAVLVGVRSVLRQRNLHNAWRGETPRAPIEGSLAAGVPPTAAPADATRLAAVETRTSAVAEDAADRLTMRTADGTYNDLGKPRMGSAGTRFGRNVPVRFTWPDPEPKILDPDPRTVSRDLLTRHQFLPATTINVLAAAWLQFMIRDWFSHGKGEKDNPWVITLREDDPWPGDPPMTILRTRQDPTRGAADDGQPPTFINTETHWWDASQLYGSNRQLQSLVRAGQDGKLRLEDGMLPAPMLSRLGEEPGWWLGLALLQTLFCREHNAICDRLRADFPSWSDEELFQRARLVNAALIAKIHTVEWTPAIISHPVTRVAMRGNWWGIAGERAHNLFGRLSDSEVISGIPGSPTDHHTADYAITEEFVAVYRMHPLTPDDYVFHSAASGQRQREATFREISGKHVQPLLGQTSIADLLYSFGIAHPGTVTLHNFPRFLQEYERPDGILVDLAATDIVRAREQGVPRYNQFRRLFHRPPVRSFEELTDDPVWAEELRRAYKGDIERVDLMVGVYAEPRPRGFGFSDTAFRVFVLMASRRLKSDRFFTTDYTPEVYTRAGLDWIDQNDMSTVLLRHFPALRPALRGVENAFAPWSKVAP
jgi:hypothetical protein